MIEIKSLLEYYLSIRKSYKDMWCQFGMNIALYYFGPSVRWLWSLLSY